MIIRSDWRGEGRNTSAPKRAMSKREAPIDIISIAQQARPNVMGQIEFLRTQLTTLSSEARTIPSCCCSPKVARRTWARSFGSPPKLSARSAPVSGFSNFGIRLLVSIAVIISISLDNPPATRMQSAPAIQLRLSQNFRHANHRQRQPLLQRDLNPLHFAIAMGGI